MVDTSTLRSVVKQEKEIQILDKRPPLINRIRKILGKENVEEDTLEDGLETTDEGSNENENTTQLSISNLNRSRKKLDKEVFKNKKNNQNLNNEMEDKAEDIKFKEDILTADLANDDNILDSVAFIPTMPARINTPSFQNFDSSLKKTLIKKSKGETADNMKDNLEDSKDFAENILLPRMPQRIKASGIQKADATLKKSLINKSSGKLSDIIIEEETDKDILKSRMPERLDPSKMQQVDKELKKSLIRKNFLQNQKDNLVKSPDVLNPRMPERIDSIKIQRIDKQLEKNRIKKIQVQHDDLEDKSEDHTSRKILRKQQELFNKKPIQILEPILKDRVLKSRKRIHKLNENRGVSEENISEDDLIEMTTLSSGSNFDESTIDQIFNFESLKNPSDESPGIFLFSLL